MKRLISFSPAQLLLVGLLALLVFGSCGGGVYGFLSDLGTERRTRLRETLAQESRAREAARRQLRGRARLAAYDRIEARTQARLDSLLGTNYERRKLMHRPTKTVRQLRSWQVADSLALQQRPHP